MPNEIAPAKGTSPASKFVNAISLAGTAYFEALPFSVSKQDQARALDRCKAAFRAAANRNPVLYECTPESLGRSFGFCVLADLVPGGVAPQVYLIPRKRRAKVGPGRDDYADIQEVDAQIAWRGYVALAERAGAIAEPIPVFEGDEFRAVQGTEPRIEHIPDFDADQSWDSLRLVYVRVERQGSGRVRWVVVTKKMIEERRAVSDSWRHWSEWNDARLAGKPLRWPKKSNQAEGDLKAEPDCVWEQWPIEQALKTAIKYAAARGYLPLEARGQSAMEIDEAPAAALVPTVRAAGEAAAGVTAMQQLADQSGLDELEELVGEEAERVVVDMPAVNRGEASNPGAVEFVPKAPEEKSEPKAKGRRGAVPDMAAVAGLEGKLLPADRARVRASLSIPIGAAISDLTDDQVRDYVAALRKATSS